MGKRRHRRKKASLEACIHEHREKIARERQKATPDLGLIHHWEREIEAFQLRDSTCAKMFRRQDMSMLKRHPKTPYLSPGTMTLLAELNEQCQRILKVSVQLEIPGLKETQVEAILGELSAAILHIHEHTRGLDAVIDDDPGAS
jgi:hypothetical protein